MKRKGYYIDVFDPHPVYGGHTLVLRPGATLREAKREAAIAVAEAKAIGIKATAMVRICR